MGFLKRFTVLIKYIINILVFPLLIQRKGNLMILKFKTRSIPYLTI